MWIKRFVDLVFAIAFLILFAPVYLILALIVYLHDGWPVLYIQERVGRYGKTFPFFKFRTMVKNAENIGAKFEIDQNDPRITRCGHFLRRWSLDELPQMFNVLRGEMSIVGPRPTLQYQVDAYTQHQRRRLEVRPGLTGLAQVSGRNRLSWPERIELDIQYIDNWSLALDLQILLRTLGAVLKPDGIYGEGWAKKQGDPGFSSPERKDTNDSGNQ